MHKSMAHESTTTPAILAQDRQAFYKALNPPEFQKFIIPKRALRYFAAPRIFDFAEDPEKVRVVRLPRMAGKLEFVVAERRKRPVSSRRVFYAYQEQYNMDHSTPVPRGVDAFHNAYPSVLEDGINFHDFVFLKIILANYGNGQLRVSDYTDRTDLQHKRIATSFYGRLREIAQAVGFRFITGWNNDDSVSFFVNPNGLARSPLTAIRPEKRTVFDGNPSRYSQREMANFTVDFLDPKDKNEFLIDAKRRVSP